MQRSKGGSESRLSAEIHESRVRKGGMVGDEVRDTRVCMCVIVFVCAHSASMVADGLDLGNK